MGRPKAHLPVLGQPQWRRGQEVLADFCREVYWSISPHLVQVPPVPEDLLINDIFAEPIGPLGGIISAFKRNTTSAYFVLACDLPFFGRQAVQELVDARDPQKCGTTYVNGQGQVEPLCGIYEPKIFSHLMQAWAAGIYCPVQILAKLDIKTVSPKYESWIANINHFGEYEELERKPSVLSSKEVSVCYYAAMREATGKTHERMNTAAKTVGELFLQVKKHYALALELEQVRFAKNDLLVLAHEPIFNQDSVVFIPTVSGG